VIDKRAFVSKFVEFINTADPALAAELVAPGARFHVPGQSEPLIGPEGYLAIIGMMRGGFADVQWQAEDSVAEGDALAIRFTMTGTHDGPFMGVPATGRPIRIQAMNFYRLAGGQIVEEHGQPDLLGLMMQIGALPLPA
jgi:steroid delta-isomerase-like uncharacterized protein